MALICMALTTLLHTVQENFRIEDFRLGTTDFNFQFLMKTILNRIGLSPTGCILLIILVILPFIPPFNNEYILRWLIAGAFLGAQAVAFDLTQGDLSRPSSGLFWAC